MRPSAHPPVSREDDNEAIGPGWLVLVVGPSGAGKDTLLEQARQRLTTSDNVRFPVRVVTRPSDATEQITPLSEPEFDRIERQGGFALSWRAHGLAYGVGAEIDATIRAGEIVIVNVSRTIIPQVRRRYANTVVVRIDAREDVRARRLAGRGRETSMAVRSRLERERNGDLSAQPDLAINNDGPVEHALHELLDTIAMIERRLR